MSEIIALQREGVKSEKKVREEASEIIALQKKVREEGVKSLHCRRRLEKK